MLTLEIIAEHFAHVQGYPIERGSDDVKADQSGNTVGSDSGVNTRNIAAH
jgi:hypothetical protein